MLALDSFLPLRELSLQRVRLRTTSFGFGYYLDAAAPCAGPDFSGFVPSNPITRFPIRNTEQEGRGIADENLDEGSMQFWLLPHGWCVAGAVRVLRRRRGQRLKSNQFNRGLSATPKFVQT